VKNCHSNTERYEKSMITVHVEPDLVGMLI
jgi:hypothetical protein